MSHEKILCEGYLEKKEKKVRSKHIHKHLYNKQRNNFWSHGCYLHR